MTTPADYSNLQPYEAAPKNTAAAEAHNTALRKDVAALPWNHPARKAARKAAEARKAAALEIPADPFAGLPGEMGA